jgi:hypothetical protein
VFLTSRISQHYSPDTDDDEGPDFAGLIAMTRRPFLIFFLANVALCLFVFRDALWGASLLAPLRVGPAFYKYYRFVDPGRTDPGRALPDTDQFGYDLPLQHTIYEAYHAGEIPWWDPYGFAGRPLLADAHINGTDPLRLAAYALLPFETAYNWTFVLHFVFSGLGVLLLARNLRFPDSIGLFAALTFEFAGCQAFYFGYPWIQGALLYYPMLWLAWDAALERPQASRAILASLAAAGALYAGNLQSHTYLVFLGAAFLLGHAGCSLAEWRRVLPVVAISGLVGACLAAPVLVGQIDFFLQGVRSVHASTTPRVFLIGLASLSSIYPWALGAAHTFDARRWFFLPVGLGQNYGIGFNIFIGSIGLALAALGAVAKLENSGRRRTRRTAVWLCLFFLTVVSSPLVTVLYLRCAGLFVLGAVILAAIGLEALAIQGARYSRFGYWVAGGAVAVALVTNTMAWAVYPRVVPRVKAMLARHDASAEARNLFKMPDSFRAAQIENFPSEISFGNPETVMAFLGLIWLSALLLKPDLRHATTDDTDGRRWELLPHLPRPVRRNASWGITVLMLANVASVALFCQRSVPREPVALWRRLLAGGSEQQSAMRLLNPEQLRLRDVSRDRPEMIFPDELQNLYHVHTVNGYSAVIPRSVLTLDLAKEARFHGQICDYLFENGQFQKNETQGKARFQWLTPIPRSIRCEEVSVNEFRLRIGPGPSGWLLWTDTFDPGWSARQRGRDVALEPSLPCFTRIEAPEGAREIILRYRPRFLTRGLITASIGLGLLLATGLAWRGAESGS